MPQHQDPLVFNVFTGKWQNASNADAAGNPLGLSIGAFDGSSVGLIPAVGNTISVDGGPVGTIETAAQYSSGGFSEDTPAYSCAILFNAGANNEQIAHLTVSGLNATSAQAVIMTSEAADGSTHGNIKHGTITVGGATTYTFTTMHSMFPNSKLLQLGTSFNLVTTDPRAAPISESWHNGNLQNNWTGSFQFTLVPLGNGGSVLVDYNLVIGGSTLVADNTNVCFVPAAYQPIALKRIMGATDGGIKSTGQFPSLRVDSSGNVNCFGVSTSATFLVGTGIYPLGT